MALSCSALRWKPCRDSAFHCLTWSGYKPFSRQYWLSSASERAAVSMTFPQGAGAAVAAIKVTYIAATQRLHHQRNAAVFLGCGEDMHMIGHEYPGMDCNAMLG